MVTDIDFREVDFNACNVGKGNPGPSYLSGIHRCRKTTNVSSPARALVCVCVCVCACMCVNTVIMFVSVLNEYGNRVCVSVE